MLKPKSKRSEDIKIIRALLIAYGDDESVLKQDNLKKLCEFFGSQPGMEIRILRESEFHTALRDHKITDECHDFGIYGESLLYLGQSYGTEQHGMFVGDIRRVKSVKEFFDSIWKIARDCSLQVKPRVTLKQVIESDIPQIRALLPTESPGTSDGGEQN